MVLTYSQVADRENVALCSATNHIVIADHRRGYVDHAYGRVHWTARRLNRLGLRHFLMLVASIKYHHNRTQPRWQKIYEQNVYAQHRALEEYHVRLPRRLSLTDRARVRYWMGRAGVLGDPRHQAVARWAMER